MESINYCLMFELMIFNLFKKFKILIDYRSGHYNNIK